MSQYPPPPPSLFATQPVAFPGDGALRSPDGRFLLVNVDPEEKDPVLGEAHALYLLDLKAGATRRLMVYARHIDACFSPDGKHLLLTDWLGSDAAEVRLYRLGATAERVNLDPWILPLKRQNPTRRHANHRYLQALGWEDAKTFRLLWWGYGPEGRGGEFRAGIVLHLDGRAEDVFPAPSEASVEH